MDVRDKRGRTNAARHIKIRKTSLELACSEGESDARAAFKFPERIWLRIPIQRLGAGGIALRLMLGPRVIGEGNIRGIRRWGYRVSHQCPGSLGWLGSGQGGEVAGRPHP